MRSFLIRTFIHNLHYKIAAVILGTILWYMVQGEEVLERNHKLLVTIETPANYVAKGGRARAKDVTIRGPRVLVGDYHNRPPLEAKIRINPSKAGPMRLRVDKEYVQDWDPRLSLVVHEPFIDITLDEKISKTVPVKEVLQGTVSSGFIIEKTIVDPRDVTVSGPKSEVQKIQEVTTEAVDIGGLQESKRVDVRLLAGSSEDIELSQDLASLQIQVGEQKVNQTFENVPVEVLGSEFAGVTKPRTVSIVIQATPEALKLLSAKDLRAFVEARDDVPGRFERQVQAKIPSDTVLIETVPEKVMVELSNQRKVN